MRSPGRCTNHEACWLGNGQRTVEVAINDPFCCPICGGALSPPPLEAIATKGIRKAVAMSAALILAAGGSGFSLVKLIHSADQPSNAAVTTASTALRPKLAGHAQALAAARAHAAQPKLAYSMGVPNVAAPKSSYPISVALTRPPVQRAAPASVTAAPPRVPAAGVAVLGTRLLRSPPPEILVAENVTREPLRAKILPVSFGKPLPPEDDLRPREKHWHYHSIAAVVRHNELLPAPGWADSDSDSSEAGQIIPDTSEVEAVAPLRPDAAPDTGSDGLPVAADPTPQDAAATALAMTTVPQTEQTETVAPSNFGSASTPEPAPRPAPELAIELSHDRLTQPIPDTAPAARVDPVVAEQFDHSPDAPARLASLRPARSDQLATPAYPELKADIDQPGRVDVGCTISSHGLPSGCHLNWQKGGADFAHSVMSWLKSGVVRYRPHLMHGQPVPETRDYHVRFEP